MVLTISMLMEAYCPPHRDIQQANQLARFSLTAGAGDECFKIHLTSADCHSTPALEIAVPSLLRPLQLTGTVK